jgi:hypothetical protein
MVPFLKVASVLSCGFLLCLGLVTSALAEDTNAGQSERKGEQTDQKELTSQKPVHVIQGTVVRVEYGTYFVKEKDGKEVSFEVNNTTQMMGQIKKGDRIVAKVNDKNRALSIQAVP